MGKRLDALFGRSLKTNKLQANIKLGISRLPVLKNQRQARCAVARSDVLQFLSLGQHERALLRVEQVIKEQNMLDVYVIIERYCHQLTERINLIEHERVCPEELKETVSSMIYAASRCGDFPELQEIRAIFTSRFGKEFVARAVELRNNCGVNPQMIQKLSTRMPSLENRMMVLKEIATENNIVLQIEEVEVEISKAQMETDTKQGQPKPKTPTHSGHLGSVEGCSDSMEVRNKYKDVAAAAQAAFESAAYAAAAARAAVELSRSDSHDPDDLNSTKLQPRVMSRTRQSFKSNSQTGEEKEIDEGKVGMAFEKIHPAQHCSSESEDEKIIAENFKQRKNEGEIKRSLSTSSSESFDNNFSGTRTYCDDELLMKLEEKEIVFDESDDETKEKSRTFLSRTKDSGLEDKQTSQRKKTPDSEQRYSIKGDINEDDFGLPSSPAHKHFSLRSHAGVKKEKATEKFISSRADHLNMEKRPISVRTKRTYGR
nr:uncharacterized protein LOC113717264 isoform X1 [Coffea arabica]XP_027097811.1 uncharacterized protein LOC113717264 isoform X1 [Coffea arabica]